MTSDAPRSRNRLVEVSLDAASIPRGASGSDHERDVALFDLIEENSFGVPGRDEGPYRMKVGQSESRLNFEVRGESGDVVCEFSVSMTPFRPLLKDYFLVCETYYSAIRTASPRQIEAIDRERSALHNEGASLVATRFADKVDIDEATSRRLFTLVSALHWKI